MVQAGQATDDNIIKCMRFACCITKATDTHSEYIILIFLFIVRRTQQCGAKLRYATINKATCFDPLGSSSGL